MSDPVFTTFYHINDYELPGYRALPLYMAISSPVVLWGPSGRLLEQCYRDNSSPISPELFLRLVEAGHIRLIARDWWYTDRERRNKAEWAGAHWVNGFDDVIERLYRDHHPAVRDAWNADGFEWAEEYLDVRPSLEGKVSKLVKRKRVPIGVQERALRLYGDGKRRDATLMVLRDLRNHVQAKNNAEARVPFLSSSDAEFFKLMEGSNRETGARDATLGRAILEAIDALVDRLHAPEQINDVTAFIGSDAQRELANWFRLSTDVATTIIPRSYGEAIRERLWSHVRSGRLSREAARIIMPRRTLLNAHTDKLIAGLAGAAFKVNGPVSLPSVDVGVVGAQDDIWKRVEMIKPDHPGVFWSHLSSY